jgi:hypothetical protein
MPPRRVEALVVPVVAEGWLRVGWTRRVVPVRRREGYVEWRDWGTKGSGWRGGLGGRGGATGTAATGIGGGGWYTTCAVGAGWGAGVATVFAVR